MNQQQFLQKLIQIYPNNSIIFLYLGNTLSPNETITLHDGREMNKQQLFLKSIQLNPNNSIAFLNLGTTLSPDETITLHDGREMNKQQLFLKSIQLDPNDLIAFFNLGATLSQDETITLHDGTKINQQQLFLKSIQLNPNDSIAFSILGATLSPDETITLHDGTKMNKQQLFLKSIQLNPNDSNAFFNLGTTLSQDETITLHDGREMNQQQLFLKSIQLNPNNSSALFELSETLNSPNQIIQLLNGKKYNKTDLFNESLKKIILFNKKSFDSEMKEIGEGGFGKVWKTKIISFDKAVALKELKNSYSIINFGELNEVKYITGLKGYPNEFVICFGFLKDAKMNTIVMELMSHSLDDEIHKHKMSISEEKVIESVAKGLKILSNHKLVHRDIKPKNILIGFNQEVKIADFGLIDLEHNLKSTQNPGTPIYQAPELQYFTENPITIAADIYSLGITIIEMNIKQKLQVGNIFTFDSSKDFFTWKKKTGEKTSVALMANIHKDNLNLMTNEKLKNIAIGCIHDDPPERLTPTEIEKLLLDSASKFL